MTDSREHNCAVHECVRVAAPARLHMGFVDLNGGGGRRFGSLGLGVEEVGIELSAEPHDTIEADGPAASRAADYARQLLAHHGLDAGVRLHIHHSIPEHSGLGSGTQLALAVGTAVARLYELPASPEQLAGILDRGNRSGIGIGTFMQGGFIVDAGHGDQTTVPPIISRLHFPDSWRLVLVMDPQHQGISGASERAAFDELEPMPTGVAHEISWLILMQALPAIAEADCERFGDAISRIQAFIGDYFAPVQGGRYCSQAVAAVVGELHDAGATGIGQSSWGPAGFAVFPSETQAHQAIRQLRDAGRIPAALEVQLCQGRNHPAEVDAGKTADNRRLRGL